MGNKVREILRALDEFDRAESSVSLELRLSLSEMILRSLRNKKWSQRRLAQETGLKEPYVSRVLHANANCTLDTVGRLLFHLGARAGFQETLLVATGKGETSNVLRVSRQEYTHGEKAYSKEAYTQPRIQAKAG